MAGLADDLSVISCHERRLLAVTGHRAPDTGYGSRGSGV